MSDFDWEGYYRHLLQGGTPFGGDFNATVAEVVETYKNIIADLTKNVDRRARGGTGEAWEVRGMPENRYSVERGTTREGTLEVAAAEVADYGLACIIEAACNFKDGTVE